MTMNTSHAIKRQHHQVLAGFAAIVLAGAALAVPSAATAHQNTDGGGSSASTASFDIADYIVARKVAWAQDRVDRAWLFH
jgi:hypothetical protein